MTSQHQTSAIILAGGLGTRMQTAEPKQFSYLGPKPIARYSFDLFLAMSEITEIVVVCAPAYRNLFTATNTLKRICFALPGERRQDSVSNGLNATDASNNMILIHDSARPFIDQDLVHRVLEAGYQHGAATVGMPVKFTIKESHSDNFVANTPDRSRIWEIQTPQVLHRAILVEGFRHAQENNITVTDDTSLAELVGKSVKLVEGSHTNLKITVPEDLVIAQHLLNSIRT